MENFYLETNEEFFSIIDRIKRSRERRITLVIPAGLSSLRSIINLKILKEEALSLGKDVSILTADSLIRKLAQQVNLMVLDKIEEREAKISGEEMRQVEFERKLKPTKRIISDIVRTKEQLKPEPIKPAAEETFFSPEQLIQEPEKSQVLTEEFRDLGEKERQFDDFFAREKKEIKKEKSTFKIFTAKRVLSFLIVFLIVGGGIVLYFVLPRAQIVINPKKEDIKFETSMAVDKNINAVDVPNHKIPAQIFQIETEDSRKFPTTGEKDVQEKAKGTIVVYNQYSSSEQALVKTTRFLSESGKIFRLVDTVVIPGATIDEGKIIPSSKEVTVEADEAGDSYNIGPSRFTIPGFEGTPKYAAFYGQSTQSMSGGAKGKMKVATQQDIDGAKEIVSLELKNKAKDEFIKKIPADLKMLDNTQVLEVIESDSTLEPDDPGTEFVVTIKVKVWGLAFKEADALSLIKEDIGEKISEDKILIPSTIKLNYRNIQLDSVQGKASFSSQVEAKTAWKLDEEKIKNDLAGKNEIEVRKYLSSMVEVDTAKVIFWPFWVKSIPSNKSKIRIEIRPE